MPSDFAKNLRALRHSRRVTQAELAKTLGYGYTAIANYESGRNEPSISDLIRLADYFQVSLDALVGRDRAETTEELRWRSLSQRERRAILDFMDHLGKPETGQLPQTGNCPVILFTRSVQNTAGAIPKTYRWSRSSGCCPLCPPGARPDI